MNPVGEEARGQAMALPGLRAQGNALLTAFQFLTLVPPIMRRSPEPAELGASVACFPIVGLALGGVLVGLDWLFGLALPPGVSAVLVLIAWVALTGALHLDGLLDACDGLLGGRSPEQRLEILRDHHVGAFALAGGVLLLLCQYAAVAALTSRAAPLLVAPVLGRWAMSLAIFAFPYARPEGLGRMLKDNARGAHLAAATVVALLAVWVIAGWAGLAALIAAALAAWGIARYTLWRIPGLTGDIYGATCIVVETVTLVLFVALGARG